ncbi:MAG: hypothetical protein WAL71_19450 [Terriglobales bacterium]
MISARWIAKCSANLFAGVVAFGIAASASTVPRNILLMADDEAIPHPVVVRASSIPSSTAKGQRQGSGKSAKPQLSSSPAPSKLRDNLAKHSNDKSGKEKLSQR